MLYKVDWTTLGALSARNNGVINITNANLTAVPSLSLTVLKTGKYNLSLTGNAQQYNNVDSFPRIGIYINETRITYAAIRVANGMQNAYACEEQWDLTKDDVVSARVIGGPCQLFEGQKLSIFRVG